MAIQRRHLVLGDRIFKFLEGGLSLYLRRGGVGQSEDILSEGEVWVLGVLRIRAHFDGKKVR